MFPVVQTIRAGILATNGFARNYPRQTIAAVAIYAASAAILVLVPPGPHLGFFVGGEIRTWVGSMLALFLLAPVWTSLCRFVILGDTERRYWPPDRRDRRVLTVLIILSAIAMTGSLPFVVFVDTLQRLTISSSWIAGMLACVVMARLLFMWLALRLSIAPAMGAAGTRPNALDTSFAYTRRAVPRLFAAKALVYLPLIVLAGLLMLLSPLTGTGLALLAHPATVALMTAANAATDFVDTATFSLVARHLARKP